MDDIEISVETAAELRDGLRQDFRKLKATSERLLAVAAA